MPQSRRRAVVVESGGKPPHSILFLCVLCALCGSSVAGELIPDGAKLQRLATGFETVEGPLYDGIGSLYFTDIPNEHIWKLDVNSLEKTLFRENTGGANGLAFDQAGRLIMCKGAAKRLTRLENDGSETVLLEPVRKGAGMKEFPVGVNDVVLDRRDAIYVTVPGAGAVYYLEPGGKNPRLLVTGLKGPNGLMLSPDEKKLYVSEYKLQRLHAYDLDTAAGAATNGRLFAQIAEASEFGSDGMTVDQKGNLYCAGPHAVRIWNPKGDLLETIPLPESPTNCTFAGKGSHVLYITGRASVYRIKMKTAGAR